MNLAIIVFFGLLLISYLLLLNCVGSEAGKEELSEIIIILLEAGGEGEPVRNFLSQKPKVLQVNI